MHTSQWVSAPGTDLHLDPVGATLRDGPPEVDASREVAGWLHTSPEFAMKRLLCCGYERIYQMCPAWRNGEIGPMHSPEFTILEWYRAWEDLGAIIEDVEQIVDGALGGAGRPFARMTMREVVEASCGFDILEALEAPRLAAVCRERGLLESTRGVLEGGPAGELRWDEIFFGLQVEHIDPWLAERGAVFVTEWPAPLAILARRRPDDPRVAERFELYVDGVELANGFQELVDPVEQRARFEAEVGERRRRGLPALPMPERLLAALEDPGMPPSAGWRWGWTGC